MRFRFTKWEWVTLSAIVAMVGGILLLGEPYYWRRYNSCALCRLGRLDYYPRLGVLWSNYEETECTIWYREHIENAHEHVWVSSSTATQRNIFGTVISIADGDPRALFRLTPLQQVEVYKHISDTKEAKQIFRVLGNDKGIDDRAQRHRIQTAAVTLREWAESDFAEPWDEIRRRIDTR